MKKTYSRKQITEAIAYWKKQLKKLNENLGSISKDEFKKWCIDNCYFRAGDSETSLISDQLYSLTKKLFPSGNEIDLAVNEYLAKNKLGRIVATYHYISFSKWTERYAKKINKSSEDTIGTLCLEWQPGGGKRTLEVIAEARQLEKAIADYVCEKMPYLTVKEPVSGSDHQKSEWLKVEFVIDPALSEDIYEKAYEIDRYGDDDDDDDDWSPDDARWDDVRMDYGDSDANPFIRH